jgi:hypothetical protein
MYILYILYMYFLPLELIQAGIYINIFIYIYMHMYVNTYVYIHMHACMYVYTYIRVLVQYITLFDDSNTCIFLDLLCLF